MSDSREVSQLKRKRDGADPQKRKAKKSRKSGGVSDTASAETPMSVEDDAGKSDKQAGSLPVVQATDLDRKGGIIGSGRKDKKRSKNEDGDLRNTTHSPVPTPSTKAHTDRTPSATNGIDLQTKSKSKSEGTNLQAYANGFRESAIDAGPTPPINGLEANQVQNLLEDGTHIEATKHANSLSTQVVVKSKKRRQKSKLSSQWAISAAMGGWFLPHDPAFSPDEKHLFVADKRAVQIYATETSLPTNTLPAGSGVVSAFSLSPTRSDHIYIANSDGIITLWDWINSTKIARWEIGTNIRRIQAVSQPEDSKDLLYCHEVGNSHVINVHALRTKNDQAPTELQRILKTKSAIKDFQVLEAGKIIVVACRTSIMIGKRSKQHKTAVKDFEYVWREVQTPKPISAFNAIVRPPTSSTKGKDSSLNARDHLDLAIGDQEGVIHLFEDILSAFARIEQGQKKPLSTEIGSDVLRPKRLHWHRETVGSVRWSLDGNYLISGGSETVLVIWQLSTGKQQTLPHLTAAIENIVVSPAGASYSVSLANNSVVVLSTTELKPKTNIIGLQSRKVDFDQLPRESGMSNYSFDIFKRIPMVVDPKISSHVLFSTPPSQPRNHRGILSLSSEPYVQTFDLASQRAVTRQALTRNNATDPNVGPERTSILEPSIAFLQISYDGKWLATVDEWAPPRTDLGFLDDGVSEFTAEELSFRREVYLKLWKWNDATDGWILDSRIDAPHMFEKVGAHARVLDLVADPSDIRFATIGEDLALRIWRPKTRRRDGVVVRGVNAGDEGLVTWSVEHTIELSGRLLFDAVPNSQPYPLGHNAQLAFSADGSVLAVGLAWSSESEPGLIFIVNAHTGEVRRSITEIGVTALSSIAIVGSSLVVLAASITVWDLVVDELVYCALLETVGIDQFERTPLLRLAANESDGTFAVACPQFEKNETSKSRKDRYTKKASSKIHIYDLHHPQPRWSSTIPEIVLSLICARDGRGYIALDASSSLRTLLPRASTLQLVMPSPDSEPLLSARGTDTDAKDDAIKEEPLEAVNLNLPFTGTEELLQDSENDKPVVRPEQLQQIFDVGSSHALPPVRVLFNAVTDLYARKPRVVTADA